MKGVELYGRVRYAVRIEGLSERAAARRFGIDPRTVSLRSLASRETVRCIPVGQGTICDGRSRSTNHGRLVAQCFLRGTDIGGVMVEWGLACDWE